MSLVSDVLVDIRRIHHHKKYFLHEQLAPYGFVGVMHLILIYIHRHPGTNQKEIAAFYILDKAGTARDTFRLEEMGCIRRETDRDDRRRHRLYTTERGEEMMAVIEQANHAFYARLSEGFTDGELETLTALLDRMAENGCRIAPQAGQAAPDGEKP